MSAPTGILPLVDYVPALSKRFMRPVHLTPLIRAIERSRTEPVRLVVSCPPRHAKSETLGHGIVWLLRQNPALRVAMISYAQSFSEKRSRKVRELSRKAGVPVAVDAQSRRDWRTNVDDGGVWASSIGGQLTGEGFDFMLIDDPVKDRATAESQAEREKAYDWFTDTAFTRLEPGGSFILCMARWHSDDLAGRLIAEGWEHITMPAIDDGGGALWPARWPVDKLREIEEQLGVYGWSSLYQGNPRPKGGQLFGEVKFYDALPPTFKVGIGVDLNYVAKTSADYSVAVVVARSGDHTYIVDVRRQQAKAPDFQRTLAKLKAEYPGASWRAYVAGTERGTADFFRELGTDVGPMTPIGDKFARAQPVSAAWNAGKVLLPQKGAWVSDFIDEIRSFTGLRDRHDDQVDALAAAFDVVKSSDRVQHAAPPLISGGLIMGSALGDFGGGGMQPYRPAWATYGRGVDLPADAYAPGPTDEQQLSALVDEMTGRRR